MCQCSGDWVERSGGRHGSPDHDGTGDSVDDGTRCRSRRNCCGNGYGYGSRCGNCRDGCSNGSGAGSRHGRSAFYGRRIADGHSSRRSCVADARRWYGPWRVGARPEHGPRPSAGDARANAHGLRCSHGRECRTYADGCGRQRNASEPASYDGQRSESLMRSQGA